MYPHSVLSIARLLGANRHPNPLSLPLRLPSEPLQLFVRAEHCQKAQKRSCGVLRRNARE